MTSQIERIAGLETQQKFMLAQQVEMDKKLDQLLTNSVATQSAIARLIDEQNSMKPHVKTVANAKTFWAWTGKVGATMTVIGATGYGFFEALSNFFKVSLR